MPSELAYDFWRGRGDIRELIAKWDEQYAVQSSVERIALLPETEDMRQDNGQVMLPAWFCTENAPLLPWICRGCGDYLHQKILHHQTYLYWHSDCVVCSACHQSRLTLHELRHRALRKNAMARKFCWFCMNQVRRAEQIEGIFIGMCGTCFQFWRPDITVAKLNYIAGLNKTNAAPVTVCIICSGPLKTQRYYFEGQAGCQRCYVKFAKRSKAKPLITACVQWLDGMKVRGSTVCLSCNDRKARWINGIPICFDCLNEQQIAIRMAEASSDRIQ